MFKPLTFGVSLAVALGACSLGFAGGHGKTLPSPQGAVAPSAQSALASAQGDLGCGDGCGAAVKKCHLFDMLKPKPKCYSYEWVLKKKRCGGGLLGGLMHGSKGGACESCGAGEIATPSAQWASPQAGASYGSGQAGIFSSGQAGTFGTGQIGGSAKYVPTSTTVPAAAPIGDSVLPVDAGVAPESAPLPPAANPTDSPSTAGLLYLSPAGN